MNVFISWSGELSKGVAGVLREYLPTMLQGLKVFMSQHDIESGARWAHRVASEAEQSDFGLLCLTSDNLNNPWLLFEAGALTKHINGKACGLLFGGLTATDVKGPLSQFQHRTLNQTEFTVLLRDLNRGTASPLELGQVDRVSAKWWSDIENALGALPQPLAPMRPLTRDVPEVLEELVERVRGIERALSDQVPHGTSRFSGGVKIDEIRAILQTLEGRLLANRDIQDVLDSLDHAELNFLRRRGIIRGDVDFATADAPRLQTWLKKLRT